MLEVEAITSGTVTHHGPQDRVTDLKQPSFNAEDPQMSADLPAYADSIAGNKSGMWESRGA